MSQVSPSTIQLWVKAAILALATLPPAALIAVLALGLWGASHGWNSPALVSLCSFALLPALAVSWTWRHTRFGFNLAVLVVVLGVALDVFAVIATTSEARRFHEAVRGEFPLVLAWTALWLLWQVIALFHLRGFLRGRPQVDSAA